MKFLYKLLFWVGIAAVAINLGLYIDTAKPVAMAIFATLFLLAIRESAKTKRPELFKRWFLLIILSFIISALATFDHSIVQAMEVAMPLVICFSSYYLFESDEDDLQRWFIPFGLIIGFCAIRAVVLPVGGLQMVDFGEGESGYIADVAKNQSCPFFAIVAVVAFSLAIRNRVKMMIKLYLLAIAIICIIPSVFLLNRTAMVSFFLASIIIVYDRYKVRGVVYFMVIGVLFLAVSGSSLLNTLSDSFFRGRDATDIDDLSSGRVTLINTALDFISNNLLIGGTGMTYGELPPNVHVFLLFKWVRFGLLLSLPFVILYISIIKQLIKAFKMRDYLCLGVLLISIIESFGEYSPPFGPGTTYVFAYIILGQFIKKYNNNNHVKKSNVIG